MSYTLNFGLTVALLFMMNVTSHTWHNKNIAKTKTGSTKETTESTSLQLRSIDSSYDYPTHCLICAETIDSEAYRRHPERYSRICNIDVVSCTAKKSIIQNTLLAACSKRGNALAIKVKARINFAGDLRAVEAKYHQSCMQTFLSKKNFFQTKVASTRNLDQANNKAFTTLCEWLNASEQEDHTFTFGELRVHLSTYLPLIRRGLITWDSACSTPSSTARVLPDPNNCWSLSACRLKSAIVTGRWSAASRGSVGPGGSQGVITSAPVLAVTSDISPDVAPVGTAGWSPCIPTLLTVSPQTDCWLCRARMATCSSLV